MARCTAKAKSTGKRCESSPIRGATVCVRHGGAAGQVKRKAAQRVETEKAVKALAVLGVPREVDPHTALLEEVHRSAGHVAALALVIEGLERERLVGGVTRTVQAPDGSRTVTVQAAYSVWLNLYRDERKHLLDACRIAVACGVARAQVELQQRQGALIAEVFRVVFSDPDVGLSAEQNRCATVVASRHLRLVAGAQQSA